MKVLHIPTGGLFSDGILSCITDYMAAMDKTDLDVRVLATNNAEDNKKVRCARYDKSYNIRNI